MNARHSVITFRTPESARTAPALCANGSHPTQSLGGYCYHQQHPGQAGYMNLGSTGPIRKLPDHLSGTET